MPSIINSDDGVVSGTSGLKTTGGNDGITTFQQNGTEVARITAAGNVGIGTSSPTGLLDVFSSSTGVIRARGSSVTAYMFGSSGGGLGAVGTETNHPFSLYANGVERARADTSGNFLFNSGYGSVATAYGCRAWVNFNGTGVVAIRASGNVSTITDNGTGNYTVNFAVAMPDANYSAVVGANNLTNNAVPTGGRTAPTVNGIEIRISDLAVLVDPAYVMFAAFR